jgi:hypothetical protein
MIPESDFHNVISTKYKFYLAILDQFDTREKACFKNIQDNAATVTELRLGWVSL